MWQVQKSNGVLKFKGENGLCSNLDNMWSFKNTRCMLQFLVIARVVGWQMWRVFGPSSIVLLCGSMCVKDSVCSVCSFRGGFLRARVCVCVCVCVWWHFGCGILRLSPPLSRSKQVVVVDCFEAIKRGGVHVSEPSVVFLWFGMCVCVFVATLRCDILCRRFFVFGAWCQYCCDFLSWNCAVVCCCRCVCDHCDVSAFHQRPVLLLMLKFFCQTHVVASYRQH